MATPNPNLSALTAQEASDLEQCAQEAVIGFKHQLGDMRGRLKTTEPGTRYYAETMGMINRLVELQHSARIFRDAANRRCREAQRRAA